MSVRPTSKRTLALLSALPLAVVLGSAAPAPWGHSPRAFAQGYDGVAPGSATVPDGIAAQPGQAALVTWPGFQALPDGGSRVFVQTTVEVKPELKQNGKHVQVLLPGLSLPPGNTRLPLDTSFFNTPVKSVRAKKAKGSGVLIELDLRANVAPTLRTEKAPTGYFFVYLEFPAGNYETKPAK